MVDHIFQTRRSDSVEHIFAFHELVMTQQQQHSDEERLRCDLLKVSVEQFLLTQHREDLLGILLQTDISEHYSLLVDTQELCNVSTMLVEMLLLRPDVGLPLLDAAAQNGQQRVYKEERRVGAANSDRLCIKLNLHVRLPQLPHTMGVVRHRLPRAQESGRLVALYATVIRAGQVKLLLHTKRYRCSRCGHVTTVQARFEEGFLLEPPTRCTNQAEKCTSFNLTPEDNTAAALKSGSFCKNYQELKVQEQANRLTIGTVPRGMLVALEDDLVEMCQPGDDVLLVGQVIRRYGTRTLLPGMPVECELVLRANHVTLLGGGGGLSNGFSVSPQREVDFRRFWLAFKERPLVARDRILASICPQVYGLYVVKLAVALILVGGMPRSVGPDGQRVRGQSHLLLVGDPGTGKSQFLKYACRLSTRSVLTTGAGSTSCGLTVTAVKEGAEWALEAGALVLSDGGICCIDEFNSIREHDKASIHEAMEQQSISVAKAGMVCRLRSRCAVLAATNPKGRYNSAESLSVNTALGSPLLSRFDLVLVLQDQANPAWDRAVADCILEARCQGDKLDSLAEENVEKEDTSAEVDLCEDRVWSIETLRTYLSHARTFEPVLSASAESILQKYYAMQRATDSRNAARTTMRLLESVIRLSQAHARLLLRDQVTEQDALVAVMLMEASMLGASLLPNANASASLHSGFPIDPDAEFASNAPLILRRLGLENLNETDLIFATETASVKHSIEDNPRHPLLSSTPILALTKDQFKRIISPKQRSTSKQHRTHSTSSTILNEPIIAGIVGLNANTVETDKMKKFKFKSLTANNFEITSNEASPRNSPLTAVRSSPSGVKRKCAEKDGSGVSAKTRFKLSAFVNSQVATESSSQYRSQLIGSIYNLKSNIEDDFDIVI